MKLIMTAVFPLVLAASVLAADIHKQQPLKVGMEMGKPKNTDIRVITSPVTADFIEAAEKNDVKQMQQLLNAGADINGKTDDKFQVTALMKACEDGHKEAADFLIKNKADPNVISRFGFTALMYASKSGMKDTVSLLLKAGADPNVVGHMFTTAIGWAADEETAKILEKAGAKTAW